LIVMARSGAQDWEEPPSPEAGRRVEFVSESVKDIARILSDDYCRRILAAALPEARMVEELSRGQSIPLSSCYRRVSWMLSQGVLVVERTIISQQGKRCEYYRSAFRSLTLRLEGEVMWAVGTINADVEEKVRSARLGGWDLARGLEWPRGPAPAV
jgi:predicted transcriptional regulator